MSFYTTGINSTRLLCFTSQSWWVGNEKTIFRFCSAIINDTFHCYKYLHKWQGILFKRNYNNETFPSKTILFQADLLWTGISDKTRNCLTWDVVNLTQHFSEKNTAVKYIEDDSEDPHHRLKSWKKVFILKIII